VTPWLGAAVAFGPLVLMALWMALLNRRDRRRDALEGVVGGCCAELGLRGAFAVHAHVGTVFRSVRVVLDMRLCSTADVWQVVERLPPRLPRGARLWIVTTGPRRQKPAVAFEAAVVAVL
jgi:hypothetical protein